MVMIVEMLSIKQKYYRSRIPLLGREMTRRRDRDVKAKIEIKIAFPRTRRMDDLKTLILPGKSQIQRN